MKKFYIFFAGLFLLAIQLKAQAPNSLNFQGIVRNASGLVLPNQAIGLRFSIHQGTPTGSVVYQETQSTSSNSLGLFTVAVGNGIPVTGTFASISWAANPEFLQVEMDPTGGTTYLDMGTNQYLSVPYALNAGTSAQEWKLTGNSSIGTGYLGTSDANDFAVKANNAQVIKLSNANSNVGIGQGSPNAGAELDVNSSTQGFLMPRLAINPTSPAQGMIYYNTATGCFMYYSGTAWNAMACPCPNTPGTPGPIISSNGGGNFCSGQAGVIYSVAPVSNAISYTWTTPSGATSLVGQGTNILSLTEGTVTTSISVTATNNCGTGAASGLTLTVSTAGAIISTQPVNTGATPTSTAIFTVGVSTGSGDTYQWQVSTNGGGSYSNVTNGAVYSGATTSTLNVTNPPLTMNNNLYKVVVTAKCGSPASATSSAATLSVCSSTTPSLPIIFTNSQTTITPVNLPVQIANINFSAYTGYENANLNNIQFSTGPAGTGTMLYAWIENGSPAVTTPATIPNSSSAAPVIWVNLGSNQINPSGGTLTIYMSFAASPVMTSTTSYTGLAPQLSPVYGQYDNGALVFTFYDNFAGNSLSSKWTLFSGGGGYSVNNGLNIYVSGTATTDEAITSSVSPFAPSIIAETYATGSNSLSGTRSYMPGLVASPVASTSIVDQQTTVPFCAFGNGRASQAFYAYLQRNSTTTEYDWYDGTSTLGGTSVTYNVWGIGYTGSSNPLYQNYTCLFGGPGAGHKGTTCGDPNNSPSGSLYLALGVGTYTSGSACSFYTYWTRVRAYPPAGILPTTTIGVFGCY